MSPTLRPCVSTALLLFSAGVALAEALPAIHLRHGIYVAAGNSCKDPAFAYMASWDGVGFGGPHDSKCIATVTGRQGNLLRFRNTCSAQGDGTPAPPSTDNGTVSLSSTTRFTRSSGSPPARPTTYRWCAPNP